MEHVLVYVTNGGYGGVQYALATGVLIVAAGTTEDKAGRWATGRAYSGVGRNLDRDPDPGHVRPCGPSSTTCRTGRPRVGSPSTSPGTTRFRRERGSARTARRHGAAGSRLTL